VPRALPRSRRRRPPGARRLAAALALVAAGCSAARNPADWLSVREVTPPFLLERPARDPSIAADAHGRVALTFVTSDSTGKDLWLTVSRDSGLTFGEPIRIDQRPASVASYPEGRPIAAFGPGGALAVAWASRRPDTSGAVDLMARASGDGGATFGAAVVVNDDAEAAADAWSWRRRLNPRAYHGFPALTFLPDGSLFAAWLDERHQRPGDDPSRSTLYAAVSADGGETWGENLQVAHGVCSCCRPIASSDPAGRVALAYRSGVDDLRDPALAVSLDGGRSFQVDTVVSTDQWRVAGCPDQGPALSWNGDRGGYYAWYTGAGRPGVYVMPWRPDRGTAGIKRLMADSLTRTRSPRLAAVGRAALLAVEAQPAGDPTRSVIAVRALGEDGSLSPWSFLGADAKDAWIAALDRRTVLACWVERRGAATQVRVVRLRPTAR
jgi:hypothetical protein